MGPHPSGLLLSNSSVRKRLLSGSVWSTAGAILSRLLGVATSIATARLLGTQDFGQLAIIASTVGSFQVFAGFGLGITASKHVAEFRTVAPARARAVATMASRFAIASGIVFGGAMWMAAPWLSKNALAAPELVQSLRVTALAMPFTTLAGAHAGTLAGLEQFRALAITGAVTSVASLMLTIVGVWKYGVYGGAVAIAVSAGFQCLLQWTLLRATSGAFSRAPSPLAWTSEWRLLYSFSLPALAVGALVTPVSWVAASIIVNSPGGYYELGLYNVANQGFAAVIAIPSMVVAPLVPILSERFGSGDVAGVRTAAKTTYLLASMTALPVALVGVLAGRYFIMLYGPAFSEAYSPLIVCIATGAVLAAVFPMGSLLYASNRAWLNLLLNLGWALVFLLLTLVLVSWGALGLSLARLAAYSVLGGLGSWCVARILSSEKRA